MNYNEVKATIEAKKNGTIRTMSYTKTLKTRKDVTDVITKKTVCQVRFGVGYENIQAVKDYKAVHGETEKSGHLTGVEWMGDSRYFLTNAKGQIQLRCSRANGNKTVSEYYKNGKLVDKSEVQALCLKSEFPVYKEDAAPQPVFNISIDKIDSIR